MKNTFDKNARFVPESHGIGVALPWKILVASDLYHLPSPRPKLRNSKTVTKILGAWAGGRRLTCLTCLCGASHQGRLLGSGRGDGKR